MKKLFTRDDFYHTYIAHRGLHDLNSGIPENSAAAFCAAAAAGYGVELDVQLSKDGQVVVFHDDTLERVCGISGRVSDYPYEDLKKMSLCETSETVALFTDVLKVLEQGCGPVVVELKTGTRNGELCRKTLEILRHYKGVFCIESFHPLIVNWFRKHAPEVFRGQLAEGPGGYPRSVPRPVAYMLSTCRLHFLNKPDFIAYEICKRPKRILKLQEKGTMLIAWTSRNPEVDEEGNDAIIFENYRPPLKY